MKANMFLIATLLILVGTGAITVSCTKEKNTQSRKAGMIAEQTNEKTGDEDPIIRVRVKKKNSLAPVDGAFVETVVYGTNVRVKNGYTDSLGEVDQQVEEGTYYFQVTVPGGSTPYVTDTVQVTGNTRVTILVD